MEVGGRAAPLLVANTVRGNAGGGIRVDCLRGAAALLRGNSLLANGPNYNYNFLQFTKLILTLGKTFLWYSKSTLKYPFWTPSVTLNRD